MSKSVELLAGAEDSEQIRAGECESQRISSLILLFSFLLLIDIKNNEIVEGSLLLKLEI